MSELPALDTWVFLDGTDRLGIRCAVLLMFSACVFEGDRDGLASWAACGPWETVTGLLSHRRKTAGTP